MRKSFVLLFSILLTLTFGSGAFAAESKDASKGLRLIELTNKAIDLAIDKAVAKGEKLQNDYHADIKSVEGAEVIISLREEQSLLETDTAKAAETEERLAAIEAEILLIENKLKQESDYFAKRTAQYNAELDLLINNLVNVTNEMTARTINTVAKMGINAVCEWEYVKIGHKWVWVDPVAVVGA
ncbi:hypothetical protein [Bacillus sp. CECT 9360]|uniref:hypothetical protein n=1 Tax=Bacillus sp. CECT 9360 TaxID=2845821 RepID=UPI001E537025|nr:hypothetical protein [Bacillus sp. CECT 9360]CAH0347646.1 hypothetical protein BCI9360_04063 [Bacillus sp. CECT 9360]